MNRKTDRRDDATYFRVNRFALQNGEWFYSTRENVERGPFDTEVDAERDLTRYISKLSVISMLSWQSNLSRKTDFEMGRVCYQMDRLALQNGKWFYATRENVERGPFDYKEEAECDLSAYLYHQHNIEKFSH